MRQVYAIALITIRNAVRSKVVLSLLVLLIAAIVLLPLSIRGDGTVTGFIQVMLTYTLGISSAILSLTTVWAGCAAVSSEIADKTIQMVAIKPVTKLHMWLGKWAGINALNLALVAVMGATTYGMLIWHLHGEAFSAPEEQAKAEQLLSARRAYQPILPTYEEEIAERLKRLKTEGVLPPDTDDASVAGILLKQLRAERNTLEPGGRLTWNVGEVAVGPEHQTATLEFRFAPASITEAQIVGTWYAGTPADPELFSVEGSYAGRTPNSVTITLDDRWQGEPCVITFVYRDQEGVNIIFDTDRLALLVPEGGFAGNHMRAMLIIFGRLSFLAALGVSAGCLFSLPVASLLSLFLLLTIQLGGYIERIAGTGMTGTNAGDAGPLSALMTLIFKAMNFILTPLHGESPLNALSTGRVIGAAWTMDGLLLQGVAYALLMGLAASYLLRRRELALPSS